MNQSVHNEAMYKSYKSRFQKLMIAAAKQYYNTMLLQNKDNMGYYKRYYR